MPGKEPSFREPQTIHDTTGEQSWKTVHNEYEPDGKLARQTIHNRDGSTIVSEFSAQPHVDGWDSRHTVTLLDGTVRTFENLGLRQIVKDENGTRLAESVWTPNGPEPQPIVQPAFLVPAAKVAAERTIVAG